MPLLGSRTPPSAFGAALALALLLAGCQGLPTPRPNPEFHAGEEPAEPDVGTVTRAPTPEDLPPLPAATPEPSPPASTPLLDAALARAEAEREVILSDVHRPDEEKASTVKPDGLASPPPQPSPSEEGAQADRTNASDERTRDLQPSAAGDNKGPDVVPTASSQGEPTSDTTTEVVERENLDRLHALAHQRARSETETILVWQGESATDPQPAAPREPAATPAQPQSEAASPVPEILELGLCKKVRGFGDYDPIEAGSCRAGQGFVLYCEMGGLTYRQGQGGYTSRLAASLELINAAGQTVWRTDLGLAEDHCKHPRRDYFVNYRLSLPADLPPGSYALRLTQAEEFSGLRASRSVPIEVRP